MFTAREIRTGLTIALLMIALGALQGCVQDALGPRADEGNNPPPNCIWINGTLHCDDGD